MTEHSQPFEILFEDNHLLVLNKPAGWIVQGAQIGDRSLLEAAKAYIGEKYRKPGDVYLGVVSRLDREVTGVLPLARTSKAAARLNAQFQARSVDKLYWAVVEGKLTFDERRLRHWLTRDERLGKTHSHSFQREQSTEAVLSYKRMASAGDLHWLEILLETGRKHQIRSQLEAVGCSIVGDDKYGSTSTFAGGGIALHCRSMSLDHPTRKERLTWNAPLPESWQRFQSFDTLPLD